MVEELLSADKTIDAMHASYTNIIKGTDRAIKYAELANKRAGDEHQEVGSLRVRLIQSTFSMLTGVLGQHLQSYTEAVNGYQRILTQFIQHKGEVTKENLLFQEWE
ncbi:hypothetical protein D3C77_649920 [compost metagenome]